MDNEFPPINITALEHLYDRERIPGGTMRDIEDYIEKRIPTVGFLKAVLSNNLKESYRCADDRNLFAIPAIVNYLYNDVPLNCWGSPEKVEKWLEGGSQNGY